MTRELELLAHRHKTEGKRFTAVSLHSALFRYDRELRYAPFYVRLTDHECVSIELTPLSLRLRTDRPTEMTGSVPEPLADGIVQISEPGARVLLAINTTLSPGGDLIAFLRSEGMLPSYVSSMEVLKVEGVYNSRSTLTLVSLPLEVWNVLPKDPAISTVGIVTSDNLLQEEAVMVPELRRKGFVKRDIAEHPRGWLVLNDLILFLRNCGSTQLQLLLGVLQSGATINDIAAWVNKNLTLLPDDDEFDDDPVAHPQPPASIQQELRFPPYPSLQSL